MIGLYVFCLIEGCFECPARAGGVAGHVERVGLADVREVGALVALLCV